MSDNQIVRIPVSQIITFWRPGSKDDNWTWADEYRELAPQQRTMLLRNQDILRRSLRQLHPSTDTEGALQEPHPITLGNDGRVWDGHHRIIIAIQDGYTDLEVQLIQGDPQ